MLDPKGKREVKETFAMREENLNLTILSITHDIEEAAIGDRVSSCIKAKVILSGKPLEVFKESKLKRSTSICHLFKMKKALKKQDIGCR